MHTPQYTYIHTAHTVHNNTVVSNLISEPIQQPQALSTDQPKLDVSPQSQPFSKDMSYEQLAVWLTNHPLFVGADYQQDICKLKGTY